MRNALVILSLLALALPVAGQERDFSKVEIKVTKVAGTVYMLEGAGGNIGVSVGDDGVLIVDDQYAPLAPKIQAALKTITAKPVRFVLNTHWHGDHVGGNEIFGATAPVIAHTNVRERMSRGATRGDEKIPAAPAAALPVVTFDDRLTIHLNGENIKAIHFPHGHTDGDSVIFFTKSNVVHVGDDYFSGRFPFIDLDSGGSVRGLIRNLDAVVAQLPPDVKVIPGHGPLSTLEDLKLHIAGLKDIVSIVDKGMAAGKTAGDLKKEKALAKYEAWSWQFMNAEGFIDTLFEDFSRKP